MQGVPTAQKTSWATFLKSYVVHLICEVSEADSHLGWNFDQDRFILWRPFVSDSTTIHSLAHFSYGISRYATLMLLKPSWILMNSFASTSCPIIITLLILYTSLEILPWFRHVPGTPNSLLVWTPGTFLCYSRYQHRRGEKYRRSQVVHRAYFDLDLFSRRCVQYLCHCCIYKSTLKGQYTSRNEKLGSEKKYARIFWLILIF